MNGRNGTMSNKKLEDIAEALARMGVGGDEQVESNGWAAKETKPLNAPFLGVSVPIKVETPQGSARCYIALPPEVASSPEALLGAIKRLLDMGMPVDLYQPKPDNGWQNGRGGQNNGGWQRNGGYGGGGSNYPQRYGYQNGGGNRGGW